MTMGDRHGQVNSSNPSPSAVATNNVTQAYRVNQNKYPYSHVTRGVNNKMLTSYTLPGQVRLPGLGHHLAGNMNNNNNTAGVHHPGGLMQPPSFTVLAGLHHLNASPDHSSLPSSDIGEVDLDLWDLDINAPSVSPQSSGNSPAALPPGRRSSDTSSTSG